MQTLKILGYTYGLYTDGDSNHIGAAGRMNTNEQKIQIGSNLSQEQQESTILHEAIEVLNYHLAIGLDEQAIMRLESGLYQFLVDNGVSLASLTKSKTAHEQSPQAVLPMAKNGVGAAQS